MKLLLTGGTGFIGRRLTERLLARGWHVTALVRRPESAEARGLAALGATLAVGSVTERDSMLAAMRDVHMVVHNAGWYELGLTAEAREQMRQINVEGTRNTLGLAVALAVPRIVYTSSVVAFGDTGGVLADERFVRRAPPASYYERTKAEAHAIATGLAERGAPIITVCPSQVIGPGDHSAWGELQRLYVRGLFPGVAWGADYYHAHTHVDDVAEGIALACERGRPGETYILAGENRTVREIMAIWARHPGGQRVRLWLPAPAARLMAAPTEVLLRAIGQTAFISREAVTALCTHLRFSGAKAEQELGARFRGQEQLWAETLAAERAAIA
ncbi:MAG: NAD-dependent epimerase/dehydratase family protein [Chloroflexi bacterium OHK40]